MAERRTTITKIASTVMGASLLLVSLSTPDAMAQDAGAPKAPSAHGLPENYDGDRSSVVVEFEPISEDALNQVYQARGEKISAIESTTPPSSVSRPSTSTTTKVETVPSKKRKTTKTVTVTVQPEPEEVLPPEWDGYIYDENSTGSGGVVGGVSIGDIQVDWNASKAEQVVQLVKSRIGVPYVWGGNSWESGLDCSSLVQQTFQRVGVSLPRTTWDQVNSGTSVSVNDMKAGDLIFYNGTGHVAVYIGNNQVVHAPQPGQTVTTDSVSMMPIENVRRVL